MKMSIVNISNMKKNECKEKKMDTLQVWSHTNKFGIDLILTFAIE